MEIGCQRERVIISGAGGFIGRHLCKKLIEKGYEVYAILRSENGIIDDKAFHHICVNLLDETDIGKVYNEWRNLSFTKVFHLAWNGVSNANQHDESVQLENALLACNLFRLAEKLRCTKFVFAGSIIAYETMQHCMRNEPIRKASVYGTGKLATHFMLKAIASSSDVEYCEAIISNVYGPGEHSKRLVNNSIRELLANRTVKCSAGTQPYDFIYIDDAVEKICRVGEIGQNLRSYYIGNRSTKPLKEFLLMIEQIVKEHNGSSIRTGKLEFAQKTEIDDSIDFSIFEMEKAEVDLGYSNRTSFTEGIRNTVKWIINNG